MKKLKVISAKNNVAGKIIWICVINAVLITQNLYIGKLSF